MSEFGIRPEKPSVVRLLGRQGRIVKRASCVVAAVAAIAVAPWLGGTGTSSAATTSAGNVVNGGTQFEALSHYPEALGFWPGDPKPTNTMHFQGIARYDRDGVPYLVVTQNRNPSGLEFLADASPGYIWGIKMASRTDRNGERLGSNRLVKGLETDETEPPLSDKVVWSIKLGTGVLGKYAHPGGVHVLRDVQYRHPVTSLDTRGDVLIVAMDHRINSSLPKGRLVAFDLSADFGAEGPPVLWQKDLSHQVDPFAITQLTSGNWLLFTSGDNGRVTETYTAPDLASLFGAGVTARDWASGSSLYVADFPWPKGDPNTTSCYQHMNFLRDAGHLYLLTTHNASPGGAPGGWDHAHLFWVDFDTGDMRLTEVALRHFICSQDGSGVGRTGNFAAAACSYVSPTGELILYTLPHTNCGPGGSVPMGEFRHMDVVLPSSPLVAPGVDAHGPYTCYQGQTVRLEATGRQAASPWIDMYDNTWGWNGDDRRILVEYRERELHELGSFRNLDGVWTPGTDGFGDKASALRYHLPYGLSAYLYEDHSLGGDSLQITQAGGNPLGSVGDLDDSSFNDKASSLDFSITLPDGLKPPGTGNELQYAWDLPGGGGYGDATGRAVYYRPDWTIGTRTVRVQVTDGYGGSTGNNQANDWTDVTILNVAPTVDAGAGVTALPGDTVRLASATFTDPGVGDAHTARIDWGDGTGWKTGTVKQSNGHGTVSGSHTYPDAGTYTVTVEVSDAWGGIDTDTFTQLVAPPPDTTMHLSGTLGDNGWYTSPVTVSLTATDNSGTGIHKIQYAFAGDAGWTEYVAGHPIVRSDQGSTKVHHRASDARGVWSAARLDGFRVDTVGPRTRSEIASVQHNPASIELFPEDAASGPRTVYWSIDGGPVGRADVGTRPASWGTDVRFAVPGLGLHSIQYWSVDEAGNAEATHTALYEVLNAHPRLTDDTRYNTGVDKALVVPGPGVLANDHDFEGDPFTASLLAGPSFGSVLLNADGSFTYWPGAGFVGRDTFTYVASDASGTSAPAEVRIMVNDRPVANDDGPYTVPMGGTLAVAAPGLLGNDTGAPGADLRAMKVSWGTEVDLLRVYADGRFEYVPKADFWGATAFTYKARDQWGYDSDPATVSIFVEPNTPAGQNVGTSFTGGTLAVAFSTVASPGVTTAWPERPPDSVAGVTFLDKSSWEATTTASFEGSVTVSISYDPWDEGINPDEEDALRMWYWPVNDSHVVPVDITSAVDPLGDTVSGEVSGLGCFALGFSASDVVTRTIYVSDKGNDANAGTETHPLKSITRGMSIANAGDRVWVAAGRYSVARTAESFPIALRSGVTLQGAYRSQTEIVGNGSSSVFSAAGVDASATVVGFTISGGNGAGGAFHLEDASPLILDCTITGNHSTGSGGAIAVLGGSAPRVVRSTLSSNTAAGAGGGVYLDGGHAVVEECTLTANSASGDGGAIAAFSATFTVTDSFVASNTAVGDGGGIAQHDSSAVVSGCTFVANAGANGGALHAGDGGRADIERALAMANHAAHKGGGFDLGSTSVVCTESVITSNSAGTLGGAISVAGTSTVVSGSEVTSNTSGVSGGGIACLAGSSAELERDTISGNTALGSGADEGGGGILVLAADPTLTNVVVHGNTARGGGGVYCVEGGPVIVNCTVADNTATSGTGGGVACTGSPEPLVFNSIVWGNGDDLAGLQAHCSNVGAADVGQGAGNVCLDPLFVGGGDYHVLPGSRSIDHGVTLFGGTDAPDADFGGSVRGQGAGVDMGAYETAPNTHPGSPALAIASSACTLTCDAITGHGTTSVYETGDAPDGPGTIDAFGPILDVVVTASHTGTITIDIPYDESDIPTDTPEQDLRLWHFERGGSGIWTDVTTVVDTEANIISGEAASLSWFAIGEFSNEPPLIDGVGPFATSEGSEVLLDATPCTDPDGDALTYSWDLDGDGSEDSIEVTLTHTWTDDLRDDVVLTVSDGLASTTASIPVTVSNVAPTSEIGLEPDRLVWGEEVTLTADYSDPGDDTHTVEWDFGDGAGLVAGLAAQSGPALLEGDTVSHAYGQPGTFTVTMPVTDDDGSTSFSSLVIDVDKRWTSVAFDPSNDATGQCSDPVSFAATVTDEIGQPVAGVEVGFSIGAQVATATTDGEGVAEVTVVLDQSAGTVGLGAAFAGSSMYEGSAEETSFEVERESVAIGYSGDVSIQRGQPTTLTATLADGDGSAGPISGKAVTFKIVNGGFSDCVYARTDASGVAMAHELVGVPDGACAITAVFGGDAWCAPASTDEVAGTIQLGLVGVAGSSRYATAVEASKRAYPVGASTVVIATGVTWPDALGGAALAGTVDGPLLLTMRDSVPDVVLAEVTRLGATDAYLLGGTGAVSAAVESTLRSRLATVTRIAGVSRYDTAGKVADEVIRLSGESFTGDAFVATGINFPDALGASPLAASLGRPVLLAAKNGTPYLPEEVDRVVILGGTGAVTSVSESSVKTALGEANVERIGGSDRYDTAARIADYGVGLGMHWDGVGIATGASFPDALSGGAMLGRLGSVLLLTRSTSLVPPAEQRLVDNNDAIGLVYYVGGTGAVGPEVRDRVAQLLE